MQHRTHASRCLVALLCLVLAATYATANVTTKKSRQSTITKAQTFINQRETTPQPDVDNWKYAFSLPIVEAAPVVVQQQQEEVVVVEKVVTPEVVLDAAASNITPQIRGIITRGGVPHLILGNGPLPQGAQLNLTYEGKSYLVVVESVSKQAYKLRLDETTKVISLKDDTNTGAGVFKPNN